MVVLLRMNSETNQDYAKEPRWLAIIAMLATGLVYAALPITAYPAFAPIVADCVRPDFHFVAVNLSVEDEAAA